MVTIDFFGTILSALALAGLFLWVWMLVECLKNSSLEGKDKLVWILALLVFNVFGAIAYFAIVRPQPTNEA